MLEIKNLSIEVNDKYIVKNLNVVLNSDSKLAVIGEEGNGKSTLLKVIAGICDYANIEGQVVLNGSKISYLSQTIGVENKDLKVAEFLFLNDDDYYNNVGLFYKYAKELDYDDALLEQDFKTLSGGEKVKTGIIKMLLESSDILLLDEPTNDLDLETLEWLEKFIVRSNIPIMYVSHDEELLSKTANFILHLEQLNDKTVCKYTLDKCGYDEYVEKRIRKQNHQRQVAGNERREFRKVQDKLQQVLNRVEYQQRTISRSDPHGARLLKKKMHSLKSQEKRLANTELTEFPDVEEAISFFFKDNALPNGKVLLNLEIPVLKNKDKILARNVKLYVMGNEHICIIGKNGCGKTTLVGNIIEELSKLSEIKLGVMSQNYEDVLSDYENVLDLAVSNSKEDLTKFRTLLASLNFTNEECLGKTKDLSNGSKAKLILAHLVVRECNCLVLDEPTRNVSPLSNPVIRSVLKNFKGPIISVSHDRKYLSEVAERVVRLDENGLEEV